MQVYGWGLYGSSERDIAQWYAEKDVEHKKNIAIPVTKLKRNLYRQTFFNGKNENLLDWEKPVTEEQGNQILDALAAEGKQETMTFVNRWLKQYDIEQGIERDPEEIQDDKYAYFPEDVLRDELERWTDFYEASGEYVYKQLTEILGSPKAASEFLYRAGIDGIKYIGETSGIQNYVAFSDKDIKVDEHIKYSIAGTKALDNLPEDQRKAYLKDLDTAHRMTLAGKTPKDIKLATGWELGHDQKWRFELPDLKIKTKGFLPDGTQYDKTDSELIPWGHTLDEYVDAPELFSAYPKLKNIKLVNNDSSTASYYPDRNMISISPDVVFGSSKLNQRIQRAEDSLKLFQRGYTENQKATAKALGVELHDPQTKIKEIQQKIAELKQQRKDNLRSVLIHEVQHAIQDIEGFAEGGSLESAYTINDENDNPVKKIMYQKRTLENLSNDLFEKIYQWEEKSGLNKFIRDKVDEWEKTRTNRNVILNEIQKFKENLDGYDDFIKIKNQYDVVSKQLSEINADLIELKDPVTRYHRLAGEVEARNAQTRAHWDEQERRNSTLAETEDVPAENQIILPKFSLRQTDHDYMDAVNRGDMETAQKMVNEAARKRDGISVKDGEKIYTLEKDGAFVQFYKDTDSDEEGNEKEYVHGDFIFTPEEKRGKGLARNLIHHFFNYAKEKFPDIQEMRIAALPQDEITDFERLVEFYESEGFDAIPTEAEAVIMVRDNDAYDQPVKYKNGNVIPLSERFNRNNPDIRYSLQQNRSAESDTKNTSSLLSPTSYLKSTSSLISPASYLSGAPAKRKFSYQTHYDQVNPVTADDALRQEYQDLIDHKIITKDSIPEIKQKAENWIKQQGGVLPAATMIANETEHSNRAVASIVRTTIMNSEAFAKLPYDLRQKVYNAHLETGKNWSQEGNARQLRNMIIKDPAALNALLNKIQEKLPDMDKVRFRNSILADTGIDIIDLPDDIVNDPHKLDAVLRSAKTQQATFGDKVYEAWINGILSAPHTHLTNTHSFSVSLRLSARIPYPIHFRFYALCRNTYTKNPGFYSGVLKI